MTYFHSSFKLNGQSIHQEELIARANQKSSMSQEAWERSLYEFILEWIDDSPTVIVQTSGSTGKPKPIKLEKERMAASAAMTCSYLGLRKNDTALLCLSCKHIAGKMMAVRSFVQGLNLIPVAPEANPLEHTIDTDIDFMAIVPYQLQAILSDPKTAEKLKQIKNVLVGGAPVSNALQSTIQSFPNAIYETFGMTETISHIALKLLSQNSSQTYFEVLDDIKIDTDHRQCLSISSPKLLDQPIQTNDMVKITDKKRFTWLGRFDNVINSGGVKLFPEKLEQKLSGVIPFRFFLGGVPDEKLGERLVLIIEDPKRKCDLSEVQNSIKQMLDKYEQPKEILVVEQFIQTDSGKLNRQKTLNQLFLK